MASQYFLILSALNFACFTHKKEEKEEEEGEEENFCKFVWCNC